MDGLKVGRTKMGSAGSRKVGSGGRKKKVRGFVYCEPGRWWFR